MDRGEASGKPLRNIRLIIQFDGTDFWGWQEQGKGRTVQKTLREAIERLANLPHVTIYSSSRTDSGVHALAMPVNFRIETTLPLKAFVLGLNSMLPKDLQVLRADEMPLEFHARFSAKSKTYVYRILQGPVALPLESRTAWHVRKGLCLEKMNEAAALLLGTHDFSSFRAAECDSLSPVRTLYECSATEEKGIVKIEVKGDGFLRNMVRIIAGTLVEVGTGKKKVEWVKWLLEVRDRRKAGPTAPACGLFLKEVEYGPQWQALSSWPP